MSRSPASFRTDRLVRLALVVATLVATLPAFGSVREWTDAAAEGYRKYALHQSRSLGLVGDNPVAIVFAPADAAPRVLADSAALAHSLARALERADHRVVSPRRDFSALDSWDHVGCDDGAAERLGWNVIELRVEACRGRSPRFAAHIRGGELLHSGPARVDRESRRAAEAAAPPFPLTTDPADERRVASWLAHALACEVKSLPEKRLLEIRVAGQVRSPHEAAWIQRVGSRLVTHLNRVIRSSFHAGERQVLELALRPNGKATMVVTARVLDRPGGAVLAKVPASDDRCLLRAERPLDPGLGDLGLFGTDLTSARGYLRRAGLQMKELDVSSTEPAGTIVGQSPDARTPLDRVRRRTVVVHIAARSTGRAGPEPSRAASAKPPLPPARESMRTRIVRVANELDVSAEAWMACLDIFGRPVGEQRAFSDLLERYDPRSSARPTREVWRAWYEFAHPYHEPYFPDSPVNRFAAEVAAGLLPRIETARSTRP
jgi:hypothetical protein